ncbi:Map microtubule affinity-regulating kinase [Nowakowskiella sp. JEL0407]|nr:Map microtubule affinity-regulating kinase [Nowakowskiella sp. JEL0407]
MNHSSSALVQDTGTITGTPCSDPSRNINDVQCDRRATEFQPAISSTGLTLSKQKDQTVVNAKHKHLGNYEILKTIGEGSFAKVKLGIHRLTNQQVAIKIIDKDKLPDEYSLKNLHREVSVMRLLDHPNIIKLYEVIETKKELHLVLEYAAGGEVLDYIVAHGKLKESEAKKFIRQIVSALEHCHAVNVVHRDLKAENLLLDSDMNIKISDFGLSNIFDRTKTLATFCGSPVYSAPELIEGKKYIGPEVDAWSLGINLYAMVIGDLPFADSNLQALYDSILKCKFDLPSSVSAECKDLIQHLLVINPKKRFTATQVKEHPWIVAGTSFLDDASTTPKKLTTENDLDPEVMEQLETMGFEHQSIVKSVLEYQYNQISATYHLLLTQKTQNAEKFAKDAAVRKTVQEKILESGDQQNQNLDRIAAQEHATEDYARILLRIDKGNDASPDRKQRLSISNSASNKTTSTNLNPNDALKSKKVVRKLSTNPGAKAPKSGEILKPRISETEKLSPGHSERPRSTTKKIVRGSIAKFGDTDSETEDTHARHTRQLTLNSNGTGKLSANISTNKSRGSSAKRPSSPHINSPAQKPPPGTSLPPITSHSDGLSNSLRAYGGKLDIPSATDISILKSKSRKPSQIPQGGTGQLEKKSSNTRLAESARRKRSATISVDESLYIEETGAETHANGIDFPRTIRFAFNCSATSNQPPQLIFSKLQEALNKNHVKCIREGFLCEGEVDSIKFEAEICKIPGLAMFGLRMKRIVGDPWKYKNLSEKITSDFST